MFFWEEYLKKLAEHQIPFYPQTPWRWKYEWSNQASKIFQTIVLSPVWNNRHVTVHSPVYFLS
jgi:hypothetical protein